MQGIVGASLSEYTWQTEYEVRIYRSAMNQRWTVRLQVQELVNGDDWWKRERSMNGMCPT